MQRLALASFVLGAASLGAVLFACSTGEVGEPASGNANAVANASATSNVPTFATEVEPIIQDRCQSCHRAGGIAPFTLLTYEEVVAKGELAKAKVTAHEMPPWGLFDQDDCKMQRPVKDDLRLTDAQIDTIARWVDGGMPMGDASKRPPARTTFPPINLDGDNVQQFQMAKPYKTEPGTDDIRCFPIDPGFTEDTWITGTNVVPGDARIVHHVIVYLDKSKKAAAKAGAEGNYKCFGGPDLGDGGGGTTVLLAWAPGVPPTGFGNTEAAIRVPKGSGLVMQVHYHPSRTPLVDQSKIELRKLPKGATPSHVAQVVLAGNAQDAAGTNTGKLIHLLPGPNDRNDVPEFFIPSGATAHTEKMAIDLPSQLSLLQGGVKLAIAGAHMHWAGVNMKINVDRGSEVAGQPDKECLMSTPKYDFNWQRGYQYDQEYDALPSIKGGDTLSLECTYNNSTSNRNVAKAIAEVPVAQPFDLHLGETTQDEMCLAALVIVRPYISLVDK